MFQVVVGFVLVLLENIVEVVIDIVQIVEEMGYGVIELFWCDLVIVFGGWFQCVVVDEFVKVENFVVEILLGIYFGEVIGVFGLVEWC